jgi:hypothetical protein
MERLEGELARKKVNIFTDIRQRMKERPFSLQSSKGRGHEGFRSSFAPRSVLFQPEQSKFMSSEINSAVLHPNITNLKLDTPSSNDVPYHPNSPPKTLPDTTRKEEWQEGDTGSSRAPTLHQDQDHELPINYHNNVRTNIALRPFPMDLRDLKTAHHSGVHSSSKSTEFKRVLDHSDGECGRNVKRPKEDDPK